MKELLIPSFLFSLRGCVINNPTTKFSFFIGLGRRLVEVHKFRNSYVDFEGKGRINCKL